MNETKEKGLVLVTALWLLLFMSMIASALAWSNRETIRGMAAIKGGVQARYLAEGALQLVYINLLNGRSSERLLADGQVIELKLPGGNVGLKITDENGKVDINGADRALLVRLLYSLDVDSNKADALADAIIDYRDKDDFRHLNGAEDSDYEAAGLAWGAKNALFSSTGELRRVLGMDTALFEALSPHVTIYTRQKGVNPEVASLPVLLAVSSASEYSLQAYIEQRRQNHADGLPLPKAPQVDRRFLSRSRGVTYNLMAAGQTAQGGLSGFSKTVRLRRNKKGATIQTLGWEPYLPGGAEKNRLLGGINNSGSQGQYEH